jgi:alpha-L-rhamnosidase
MLAGVMSAVGSAAIRSFDKDWASCIRLPGLATKFFSGVGLEMKATGFFSAAVGLLIGVLTVPVAITAQGVQPGPTALRVDDLETPLGIDDATPRFSWQVSDPSRGAKQSAYQVQVASSADLLKQGNADVWDSGRVNSGQALNVIYAGPAVGSSRRYFWRVKLWGADSKPYPESLVSWWETGLLKQDGWQAKWIGYETPEEAAARSAAAIWITDPDVAALMTKLGEEQRVAYRTTVKLTKAVQWATLYATGEDTVAAWVNGAQVMTEAAYPPWKHLPWKKFVRADVASKLNAGENSIAIECLHYVDNSDGNASKDAPPLIATLVVGYADGSTGTFASDTSWRSSPQGPQGWREKGFDDSKWKQSIAWKQTPAPNSAPLGNPWLPDSVKELRQTFSLNSPVKSARLYATALGGYELFLNGKRVSKDMLAPGWTDYRQRVLYQTYDVTDVLAQGKNAIGALLAPGWYATPLEWLQQPNNYGDTPPALRAQLRIEHEDGTVEWVVTGPDWQANTSEILHSELYDGETQDARLAQPGWDRADFDAKGWKEAIAIEPKPIVIAAQEFQPIRVEMAMPAKTMKEPKPGVYIYDFGQNFSGVERLNVQGPAGTDVQVRFGEILNADGTLYTDNLRTAKATDHFILDGKSDGDLIPRFTFHGFRYAEVTGLTTPPKLESMHALVFHTDAPFSAEFKSGSTMIDKLWSNILWGQRSNFVGIPTDCPQRDERLGWMADAQVFWRTASYNMELASFTRKFATDMRGTQIGTPIYGIYAPGTAKENMGTGAGWSDAGVIIPWTSWLQTGDTQVIEQNWTAMEKYLAGIEAGNPDGLWKKDSGTPFGDWLSPEGPTDFGLVATAYWAYDVTLMKEMAHATGRSADEQKYAQLFDKIRVAFVRQYVHDDGFIAGADNSASPFGQINNPNARSRGGDTQTGYVLALHMNLVPEGLRATAAQKLVDKIQKNNGLLGTGFLGTPYLLEELTKTGHADLAYKLLMNTQYPSWGYVVEHGATTTWERWNGDQMKDDPQMNSYNHYAYGAVADWIYRYAAGIDTTPLDAGFHTVVLHPAFDARLGNVDFKYESSYGKIRSSWKVEGKTAKWTLEIPANTTAWLDVSAVDAEKYKLEGAPLKASKLAKAAKGGFELGAGKYQFEVGL